MDATRPYADVMPGPRGSLLATLVALETPISVRALARDSGISAQHALNLVHELAGAGLVRARRAGPSLMVSLNRDHLAAEPVIALVALRARLVDRLKQELQGWTDLAGGWLYGSMARGDGGRGSDVDVLLVSGRDLEGAEWGDATARLRSRVEAWTGNGLQLVEHTRRSFAELVRRGGPLVAAVRRDGIPLTDDTQALFRGAA